MLRALRIALLAILASVSSVRAQDSTQVFPPIRPSGRPVTMTGSSGMLSIRLDSLRTPPAPTLDRALRQLPFVLVRDHATGEAEFHTRDSRSRTTTVLLDGVPTTIGSDSRMDPSLFPLTGAATLRLSRTMHSILAGPNAVNSIIEIDAAGAPVRDTSAGVAAGAGERGARVFTAHGAIPFQLRSGSIGLRAGAAIRDRSAVARASGVNEPNAPDGEHLNADARLTDFFTHAQFGAPGGAFFRLGVLGYQAERGVRPELEASAPFLWRYPSQKRVIATFTAGSAPRWSPFGAAASFDGAFGLNAGQTDVEAFADRTYQNASDRGSGDDRTLFGRIGMSHTLPNDALVHVGGTMSAIRYLESTNGASPVKYTQKLASFGVEGDWNATERLAVSAGLGWDRADNPETGPSAAVDADNDWAGRFGATRTSGRFRYHVLASQRSRYASLREQYSGLLGRFAPNPTLRPERVTVIEGGATHTRGTLVLQGVLFRQLSKDAIVRVTLPDARVQRANRAEIRSSGLEALAKWSHSKVTVTGELLAQRVRLHDAALGNNDIRPEGVPDFRASLGAVTAPFARITASAWVSYVGNHTCTGVSDADANMRIDLGAGRAWPFVRGVFRELRLLLAADNVADAAVFDQCGLPQPGRTLRASVSIR